MNDKFTLIAAATGGLMLSVALSGILRGEPVTGLENYSMNANQITHVQMVGKKSHNQRNQG
ncbi:hypothetical protein VB620_04270 [Nodularia harveyana UHCC-0300]|uniref:Uncharacterized protein n=1 Tax=Nodularia harveyana UHCC-0300 TaxID=2974287 RepID=A0ABU5UAK2_9CYAN|nr:hypothetical protein [Nodularia harveyana]MEA5580556.1 hypothetical protein [Nodularia harveyana UHCC-0300]